MGFRGLKLPAQPLGEAMQSRFHRTIGRRAGGRNQGETRRDKDDRGERRPALQNLTGQLNGRRKVQGDFIFEIMGGVDARDKVSLDKRARIVDQHVKPTEPRGYRIEQRSPRLSNRYVSLDGQLIWVSPRETLQRRQRSSADRHRSTLIQEGFGQTQADTGRAPSDEDNLSRLPMRRHTRNHNTSGPIGTEMRTRAYNPRDLAMITFMTSLVPA